MTDRELLELAAKACGFTVYSVNAAGAMLEGSPWLRWNPLKDAGHCSHMATQLGIGITYKDAEFSGIEGDNLFSAIQRSMTRAAAEIGKTL